MIKKHIQLIILSAGFSKRMGEFKPLLPLGNSKVIKIAISNFKKAGIENVSVVVGHRAKEIIEEIKNEEIEIVINDNYEKGMYSSIVKAVEALDSDVKGFLILPVDNPLIRERTIIDIINRFHEESYHIVYPTFNGKRGHPPLINTSLKSEILSHNGDGGLRQVLKLHEEKATEVETFDMGVVMDMDKPKDYEAMKEYFSRWYIPTEEECLALLKKYTYGEKIIAHSKKVTQVAINIVDILKKNNIYINKELLVAATMLHDIKKGEKKHDKAGGYFLSGLGFGEVGKLIGNHMNICSVSEKGINEEEILYLADKLTKNDRIIKPSERKEKMKKKFKNNEEALKGIEERYEKVDLIIEKLGKITGQSIEQILFVMGA